MASIPVKQPADALATETVEERFHRLAASWHEAVAHHSSSRVRYQHPDYLEIIRMGPVVVPLLLRDLPASGRHWFEALKSITGADPVPEADAGNVERMQEAWLRWGREHGYSW